MPVGQFGLAALETPHMDVAHAERRADVRLRKPKPQT